MRVLLVVAGELAPFTLDLVERHAGNQGLTAFIDEELDLLREEAGLTFSGIHGFSSTVAISSDVSASYTTSSTHTAASAAAPGDRAGVSAGVVLVS